MQGRKVQEEDEDSDTERDLRYLAASPKSSPKMGPIGHPVSHPVKKMMSKAVEQTKFKEKPMKPKFKSKILISPPKTPSRRKAPVKKQYKEVEHEEEERQEVEQDEAGPDSKEEEVSDEESTGKIIALRTSIDRLHYRLTNLLMLPVTNFIMSMRQKASSVISFREALKTMASWDSKDPLMLEFISLMTKGSEQHHEMLFVLEKRMSAECSLLFVSDGNPFVFVPIVIDPYRFFKKLTETLAKSTYHWSVSDSYNDSPWNLEAMKTLICEVVDIVVDFFVPVRLVIDQTVFDKMVLLNQSQQKAYPEMAYLMRFRSFSAKPLAKTKSKSNNPDAISEFIAPLYQEISQSNQQMIAALNQTNNQIEMMNGLSVQSFDQIQKMFQSFQLSSETMTVSLQQLQRGLLEQPPHKGMLEQLQQQQQHQPYQSSPKSGGSLKYRPPSSPPIKPVENPVTSQPNPVVSNPNPTNPIIIKSEPPKQSYPSVSKSVAIALAAVGVVSKPPEPKVLVVKKKVEIDPKAYIQALQAACPPVSFPKRTDKKNE